MTQCCRVTLLDHIQNLIFTMSNRDTSNEMENNSKVCRTITEQVMQAFHFAF